MESAREFTPSNINSHRIAAPSSQQASNSYLEDSIKTLKDFDWTVRIVQGSDVVAKIVEPLVSLHFTLQDPTKPTQAPSMRVIELSLPEARHLLHELQSIDTKLRHVSSD